MPIKRVERKLLAEQVARHFIDLIIQGELKPGERLPSERELASLLSVGRPAVREALRALHVLNVVEIRQGDGTYVTSLEPSLLIRPFDVFFHLGSLTLSHLFEAREVLEVGIAGKAATRMTEADLADLQACHERVGHALDDPKEFSRLDEELHEIIFRVVRNPLLKSVMESVVELGRVTRQRTAQKPEVRRQAHKDHSEIVAALARRDPEASAAAMARHLRNAWRLARLEEQRDPAVAATGVEGAEP